MNIGIIGCGVIGRTHHAVLTSDPACDGVVCCDLVPERARALAAGGPWCADPAALFSDPAIAGVTIGTPHPAHAALVQGALAAGKHVICEKPLTVHPDLLAELVAAEAPARRRGLVTAGVFQHRFSPAARALREEIAAGIFGDLVTARMDFRCRRDAGYYRADAWRGSWAGEGGGVLLNQGIHTLDLALWLLAPAAGNPVRVEGLVANRWTAAFAEVEDHVAGRVHLAGGLALEVVAENAPTAGWQPHVEIRGARGGCVYSTNHDGVFVALDHDDPAVATRLQALDGRQRTTTAATGKACYGGLHAAQFADWLASIAGGVPPRVSFADAAVANLVVLGLYHATATGRPVALPPTGYRQPDLLKPAEDPT
jgi:predicted dehydrogenase